MTAKVSNETQQQQPFKFASILSLYQKQHGRLGNLFTFIDF